MKTLREKGITLVALVVTVIILLILAGVTIAQIGGNNGLFSRTRQAVEKHKNASIDEEKYITEVESYVDEYSNEALVKIKELKLTVTTSQIKVEVIIEGEAKKIEYNLDDSEEWKTDGTDEKGTTYTFSSVSTGNHYVRVKVYDKNNKVVEDLSKAAIWSIGSYSANEFGRPYANNESSVFESDGKRVYYSISCSTVHFYEGTGTASFELLGSSDNNTWETVDSIYESRVIGTQINKKMEGYAEGYNYYKITTGSSISEGGQTNAEAKGTINFAQ